jgi:hypothetical protein
MLADHGDVEGYDDLPGERSRPLDFDETIRSVICTLDAPDALACRVQQEAIGEHRSSTDELHVSDEVAPEPRTGLMLYTALTLLQPGGGRCPRQAGDQSGRVVVATVPVEYLVSISTAIGSREPAGAFDQQQLVIAERAGGIRRCRAALLSPQGD